ncbi:MAG TPA: M28 family peptidase [Planctomycetota bacterium]|nr:M28 family peptidase [Planctomycetota bacterium]
MPGKSWSDPLPPMDSQQTSTSAQLRRDVEHLAGTIGERNLFTMSNLKNAAAYLESRFKEIGLASVRQAVPAKVGTGHNLEVEIRGATRPEEIVVVGAHYDSVFGCPGANDNATGTAALLALAASFAGHPQDRTLRFVAFVNEETPFFMSGEMGSRVYAKRCREKGDNIVAMLSLETLGCYSDRDGSQRYPFPVGLFYPSQGNFVGIVGNLGSRSLVRRVVSSFRTHAQFPSQGAALPSWLPGVGWSDHESFWNEGYSAVMLTDTAPFRYRHYHLESDTPDKIDYDRCARVVVGVREVIADLSSPD